jgi:hypothetical protein
LFILFFAYETRAQLTAFGELSFTGGTSVGETFGKYHGYTAHGIAGIQYGIFALSLGGGILRKPVDYGERTSALHPSDIDFPAGLALRIPVLRTAMLVVGSDVSGFIGNRKLMYEPHIGLLFLGRYQYRGFFFKALIAPEYLSASYIGVGLKMMIRT